MFKNFVILVDKDEKIPYNFGPEFETEICKLKTGDYTIRGYENDIIIERKSLDDYVKTITAERKRFFNEINRAKKANAFFVIIVEGSLPEIVLHEYESPLVSPEQVIGITSSLLIDYRIPVIFTEDRQHAIHLVKRILTMYWEHYCNKEKANATEKSIHRKRKSKNKRISNEDLL